MQKKTNSKKTKMVDSPFFVEDISKYEYRICPFNDGKEDSVKQLFEKLREEDKSSSFLNQSKRYFIFDYGFEDISQALKCMPLYDFKKVRNKTIGCLIIDQGYVLFFWKKSFDKRFV